MAPQFVVGIPPQILQLVQLGLLERAFHDGLFPALLFRGEAAGEEIQAQTGTELFFTRAGTMAPVTDPLVPGVDPTPQTVSYEQWVVRLARYGATIDTHIPTSVVSNASQFIRNIQQLGLQAGQSLNRIPRNALCQAYLSGQTATIAAALIADTSLRVASLNGFTDVVGGTVVRPTAVSSTTPLAITLMNAGVPIALTVVGFSPDNANDPNGPGTLLLGQAVGFNVAARSSVLSGARPRVIRMGGGSSVDAIGAGDIFTLQGAINATNWLRRNNVPPHEDGYYHGHINTDANGQTFQDPAFQRLNTSLPDHTYYQQAFIGTIGGIAFFNNNEAPDFLNCGTRTATGVNAFYSKDIGAETTNEGGVNIGRIVITGRGAIYERWLNEDQFTTETGITGKTGDFQIVNMGVTVETNNIRLVLRAPLNRLQDEIAATWSYSGAFPIPTDISSGGPQRYKRAVMIEHSLDAL